MYEIWRQRNPECRMYMDAKNLMNKKNYIMKQKKIMMTEVEEMKRELQESQRSHLEEREEEQVEHSGTKREGEQEPNTVAKTDIETEIHQQRNQIYKLKEKTKVCIIR